jgi:hypothetical protein
MPASEHLISYHILTEGRCYGGLIGEEQVELAPGDVLVFPHGDAHVMSSGRNSAAAAAAIRALSDGQLDQAAPVSLNSDAPLTCQCMLEDHAIRHSYHHLAGIRRAVPRLPAARVA